MDVSGYLRSAQNSKQKEMDVSMFSSEKRNLYLCNFNIGPNCVFQKQNKG